jgi:hypothetical protein
VLCKRAWRTATSFFESVAIRTFSEFGWVQIDQRAHGDLTWVNAMGRDESAVGFSRRHHKERQRSNLEYVLCVSCIYTVRHRTWSQISQIARGGCKDGWRTEMLLGASAK